MEDVPGYPADNAYFIYTRSENVPTGVNDAVEKLSTSASGKSIIEVIEMTSRKLQSLFASGSRADPLGIEEGSDTDMGTDNEGSEDEGLIEGYSSDEDFGTFGEPGDSRAHSINATATHSISTKVAITLDHRIRQDLKAAKLASFKIGKFIIVTESV